MAGTQAQIRFTLRQLQYFTTVARVGQISLAAVESHVSQSAMTAAIAELERVLGTALFERERSGVTLTHHGHLFLQHAHRVLEAAGDAARHPFRVRNEVQGTLALAASYTVLGYFLLPFVAKFQQQHPGVQVDLRELDRASIEASLATGDVELAVALTSNLDGPRRFRQVTLARSRRQLWVAESSPLAERAQVSLADLVPHAYILPMVDEGDVGAMRYWNEAGLSPASFIRTSSMEAVRRWWRWAWVTILSDMVFRPWSLDGRRLRAVPLKDPIPTMEVGLVWPRGQRLGPVAEAFRKYLQVAVGARGDG